MESDEENTEVDLKKLEDKLLEKIIDRDIVDSYKFFRNYVTKNPIEEYIVKKKCVEFGKELLPTDLEEEEQKKINEIYKKACMVLNEQRPARRTIKYEFQDFGGDRVIPIYKMLAKDADEAQAREDQFPQVLQSFLEQQCERHIERIQESDNEIFHTLVEKGIIKKKEESVREILRNRIKDMLESEQNANE